MPLGKTPRRVLRTAGAVLILLFAVVVGLSAYPYAQAAMFFRSEGRHLREASTLEAARQLEAESDVALRVLPSGEWMLGEVVTIHTSAGYDAIIIVASDGTTYTSFDHMCPGQGELRGFLRSLEGDNLAEIGDAIEANPYYSFRARRP